jgi:hypothetical protein
VIPLAARLRRALGRPPGAPAGARPWNVASAVLLGAVLAVMLATVLDYGVTTDEGTQNRYGRRLVRWYATLGGDDSAAVQSDLFYYGGFFELVVQGVERTGLLGTYDTRHLVNALFGFAGFVAAWGLGRHLAGAAGGFLSALFLVLTPGFYGHAFANPKDVPFASLFALAAWAVLGASERVPRLGWREGALVGAAVGLAAGVRVAAIVLYGYAAALWLGGLWLRRREDGTTGAEPVWRSVRRLGLALLSSVAVGWAVMIALWPFAQVKPFRNPFRAWQKFSQFWDTVTVLYDGQLLISRDAPRWYIPNLLTLTLPEFYPLAGLLGAAALLVLLRRRADRPREAERRIFQALWVLALAAAPVAWVVLRDTPLYNGARHLLFVVPPFAVTAGVGAAVFLRRPGWRAARATAAVALAVSLVVTLVDMVQLHPYQYVYYNRLFAGGLPGAVGRYETDYWGASFKEGIEWAVAYYSGQGLRGKVRIAGHSASHVPFWHTLGKTEDGRRLFEAVTLDQDPHVVLATTAIREHEQAEGRVVHVVERQGAPLLYVLERRAPE